MYGFSGELRSSMAMVYVWCDVVWRGGAGRCGGVVWCIPTLFKEDTTNSDIIDLVKKNQIFGAVECDIMVPETIIL